MHLVTKGHLFITGSSRSGTTTMADFLRCDRRIVMGRERYAWRLKQPGAFTPALFEKQRFCLEFSSEDSHHARPQPYYRQAWAYFDDAIWIGDKLPRLTEYYDVLDRWFPDCRVIHMLREPYAVALSYQRRADATRRRGGAGRRDWPVERGWQAAMAEWNSANRNTLENLRRGRPVFVLDYEGLYRQGLQLQRLYDFLGLALPTAMVEQWQASGSERDGIEARRTEPDDIALREAVDAATDHASYQALKMHGPVAPRTGDR
ncbi:MAG: sulfotransferase [Myxococcales bacterium]|nr:sulfotransferase [Myxococcales bacterium]MDD9965197.1 sulfotransferase [Myxococcales bacterium]